MIKIDEDLTTIRLTRGDKTSSEYNRLVLYIPYENEEEQYYMFQLDDKITIAVFEKKGYTKEEIFRKDYIIKDLGYTSPTDTVDLLLTEEDTKKFPLENKPVVYWYDVVLNDSNTVIGYDEEGPKKIIVYPEAEESEVV